MTPEQLKAKNAIHRHDKRVQRLENELEEKRKELNDLKQKHEFVKNNNKRFIRENKQLHKYIQKLNDND